MGKRGNNEGAIYKRKDGRWEVKITTGYSEDGAPIRKSTYHKTRKEAQAQLKQYEVRRAQGLPISEDQKTLTEWSEIWQKATKSQLTKATWENYDHMLKSILPVLGSLKLKDIKHIQLQQFLNDVRGRKGQLLSQSTLEKMRCVLYLLFKEAEKNELVFKNVAAGLKIPKQVSAKKEKEAFTDDEVNLILSKASEIQFLDAAAVLLATGLREGELLALLPKNVDTETSSIHVTHAMTRDKGKPLLGATKTPESVRTIPVSPDILQTLQARFRGDGEYLFSNRIGHLMNPKTFTNHYKRALETAGVRYLSPHCCRHTFASRLFAAGVNPKIIQSLMGHTDYALTANIYTHVRQDDLRSAILALQPSAI